MEYISVTEFAEKFGISERTARNYCAQGKIEGVVLIGKTWSIPATAELPQRKKRVSKVMPLLAVLREQRMPSSKVASIIALKSTSPTTPTTLRAVV